MRSVKYDFGVGGYIPDLILCLESLCCTADGVEVIEQINVVIGIIFTCQGSVHFYVSSAKRLFKFPLCRSIQT